MRVGITYALRASPQGRSLLYPVTRYKRRHGHELHTSHVKGVPPPNLHRGYPPLGSYYNNLGLCSNCSERSGA